MDRSPRCCPGQSHPCLPHSGEGMAEVRGGWISLARPCAQGTPCNHGGWGVRCCSPRAWAWSSCLGPMGRGISPCSAGHLGRVEIGHQGLGVQSPAPSVSCGLGEDRLGPPGGSEPLRGEGGPPNPRHQEARLSVCRPRLQGDGHPAPGWSAGTPLSQEPLSWVTAGGRRARRRLCVRGKTPDEDAMQRSHTA